MPKLPPAGFMLHDAIAGGCAGLMTRLVTSPLDIIKIRFQLQLEPTFKVITACGLYAISFSHAFVKHGGYRHDNM